jgi:hypothetical protein
MYVSLGIEGIGAERPKKGPRAEADVVPGFRPKQVRRGQVIVPVDLSLKNNKL